MGDRLVNVFRHNNEVVAASYQHWSAGDYKLMEDIINKNINNYNGNEDPRTVAVKILYDSLVEYNGSSDMVGLLVEGSEDELKFASLHPEIPSDPDKIGRTYGMISIDPDKIDSWRDWAEYETEFKI